jgi:hypothetical protein
MPVLRGRYSRRHQCAFTLAEVLAALLFMAIVIPVAVEGLRIANLAGQVGTRKAAAARIGDNVLNELIATGDFTRAPQRGTVLEGVIEYNWETRLDPWSFGTLKLLTVQVFFPAQGQEYDVRLTTLVDTTVQ